MPFVVQNVVTLQFMAFQDQPSLNNFLANAPDAAYWQATQDSDPTQVSYLASETNTALADLATAQAAVATQQAALTTLHAQVRQHYGGV